MAIVKQFEGKSLSVFEIDGEPYWIAKQVGEVLQYGNGGGNFVKMISRNWRSEFEDDFQVLRGEDLVEFKTMAKEEADMEFPRVTHLMLLSESGVRRAALRGGRPVGIRLREWLVEREK